MKILLVRYTPRENSNTAKLVEIILNKIGTNELVVRDLVKDLPPLLNKELLNSYVKRKENLELTNNDITNLSEMDSLTNEFLDSNLVVLAYPIYNYSMPAVVKAWFDSIVQKGMTFQLENEDRQKELSKKEIFIINTSGSTQFNSSSDLSTPLVKRIFGLMGIFNVRFLGLMAINYTGVSLELLNKFGLELEDSLIKSIKENP